MTVSTTTYFTDWSPANGVNKNWSYDFNIGGEDEVQILVRNGTDDTTIVVHTDDFQLFRLDEDAGYVVYPAAAAAIPAGKQIRIRRIVPLTQTTEIGNEGDFRPQLHERTFDKLVKMIQQISGSIYSSLKVIGDQPGYTVNPLEEDTTLIFKDGVVKPGPSAAEISNAQGYSEAAKAAADRAESYAALLPPTVLSFKSVSDLLANVTLSYSSGDGLIQVAAGDILGAQGFRYEVVGSGASDNDVVTAGGVKLKVIPSHGVTPAAFGAKGDGSDETDRIQKFADRMAGFMAMGEAGKEYTVRSVRWPSNTALFFAKFKTLAGNENFRSPVTVDGTTATGGGPKENYLFVGVHVNGDRQNQTDIASPSSEDGGRHGFRIVGRVANVTLDSCSAIYCATDGLAIYSRMMQNSNNDADFCFSNIRTINCRFDWNRRWGFAADSVDLALHEGGSASYNGRDLNTTDPLTHGNRGARTPAPANALYGGGWDYEDYGIGMGFRNITVRGVKCIGNYGITGFMTHVSQDDPLLVPRQNLRVEGGFYTKPIKAFDGGTDIDRPSLQFMAGGAADGGVSLFTNLYVNTRCETWLLLQGANNVEIHGWYGRLNGNSYRVLCKSCGTRLSFKNMFERGAVDLRPGPNIEGVVVTNVSGITVTRDISGSGSANRYRVVVTFTATAAGLVRFNLTIGNGFIVNSVVGQVRQNSNGNGLAVSAQVASSTQINVGVTTVASGVHIAELEVLLV